MQHHIDTDGVAPIQQQARRVPLLCRETVQTLSSKSPWTFLIVLVTKTDGST